MTKRKTGKKPNPLVCIYCKEAPRQNGQACYRCHNDEQRRERFNPLRSAYKKFLGV